MAAVTPSGNTRLADHFLGNSAQGRYNNAPVSNLAYGGQHGFATNPAQWLSFQGYVKRPLVALVLRVPKFVHLFPDSQTWIRQIKAMVEVHPSIIEGFNAELTADWEEIAIGSSGEVFHELVNVSQAKSEPSFTYPSDKYGGAIRSMVNLWMRFSMMDPETRIPAISTMADYPSDLLADWYTMTCLFYEPDPTHRRVYKAWLTVNMAPKGTGEISSKRDTSSGLEVDKPQIQWTGYSIYGQGVVALAQKILNARTINNAVPWLRPSFINDIEEDVKAITTAGYFEGAEELGASAIIKTSTTV